MSRELIEHLQQIQRKVQGQYQSLDQDLPKSVKDKRLREFWLKTLDGSDPINGAKSMEQLSIELVNKLAKERDKARAAREAASDPGRSVILGAIRQSGEVSVGDMLMANALPSLKADELSYLAENTSKAALLLAIKTEAAKRDLDTYEKKVLMDSINARSEQFVDRETIRYHAKTELAIVRAVHSYQEFAGEVSDPARNLAHAREVVALEKSISID